MLPILTDIGENYYSNHILDNETKIISPGELFRHDLLRGGVLFNLVNFLVNCVDCRWLWEIIWIFVIYRCEEDFLLFKSIFISFDYLGEEELSKSVLWMMGLFELVTINSQQILQTDKSSIFTLCQTTIERILIDINTKDLFPNIIK